MSDNYTTSAKCSGDCDSCGEDCGPVYDPNSHTITLTMEDDREVECAVLNIFQAGTQKYIVLLPLDGSSDGEAYLFRFSQEKGGNPMLDNIESPEEYQFAATVYDNLMTELQESAPQA